MDDREIRRFDSLDRVNTFRTTIAAEVLPHTVAAKNFDVISEVVNQLRPARTNRTRSANTSKEVLVQALQLDLQNITRTAIAIALEQPGFADTFRPPANSNEGAITATADAFLAQLAPQTGDSPATLAAKTALVAKFTEHDLNANFVTNLQNDRAAITAENARLETRREDSVGDNALVGPALKRGTDAVKVLDAIMHNRYGSQPDKLAAWLTASHVERDPQREKKKTPTPTPPTPPPA
jgi:hypothetical protein